MMRRKQRFLERMVGLSRAERARRQAQRCNAAGCYEHRSLATNMRWVVDHSCGLDNSASEAADDRLIKMTEPCPFAVRPYLEDQVSA